MLEPYLIQFAIVSESQRLRYPSGWITVLTTDRESRREAYKLLRAQGHAVSTLKNRQWRVVLRENA